MQNKVILGIGIVLVLIGFFKPDLNNIPVSPSKPDVTLESYAVDAPSDPDLLEKAKLVTEVLQKSDDSTRKSDCLKLSALYLDLATLISLDDTPAITDTASIRAANSLAGRMLRLNIKDKYPNLAETSRDLIVAGIGDDDIVLSSELREKASESFMALSWAFYEGSK